MLAWIFEHIWGYLVSVWRVGCILWWGTLCQYIGYPLPHIPNTHIPLTWCVMMMVSRYHISHNLCSLLKRTPEEYPWFVGDPYKSLWIPMNLQGSSRVPWIPTSDYFRTSWNFLEIPGTYITWYSCVSPTNERTRVSDIDATISVKMGGIHRVRAITLKEIL